MFQFLSPLDLLECRSVCKRWHQLITTVGILFFFLWFCYASPSLLLLFSLLMSLRLLLLQMPYYQDTLLLLDSLTLYHSYQRTEEKYPVREYLIKQPQIKVDMRLVCLFALV